ncbi:MAG: polyprenyl synthetase family protein [Actinomycetota bacterium]
MTGLRIPRLDAPDAILEGEVRARLGDVEHALAKAVEAESEVLSESSAYLLEAGGKRFRPMLVLLAGYFGDPSDTRLIPGAVAIELTHLATLYHDDVIDEADSRRGIASANSRWDNTVAILTGDYLFARASEISSDLGTEVTRLLAKTIATVCDGQIREVAAAGRVDQSEEDYLKTIARKTAALIATSCRLGGMLSDSPAEHLDALEGFGEALGTAFQLSDDIMDVTSTSSQLGKEPGIDLREGVYTLPVLHALGQDGQGEELRGLLEPGPPDGGPLERALEIVRGDGSLDYARRAVSAQVGRAKERAALLPEGRARMALLQLAEFLAIRCGAEV